MGIHQYGFGRLLKTNGLRYLHPTAGGEVTIVTYLSWAAAKWTCPLRVIAEAIPNGVAPVIWHRIRDTHR